MWHIKNHHWCHPWRYAMEICVLWIKYEFFQEITPSFYHSIKTWWQLWWNRPCVVGIAGWGRWGLQVQPAQGLHGVPRLWLEQQLCWHCKATKASCWLAELHGVVLGVIWNFWGYSRKLCWREDGGEKIDEKRIGLVWGKWSSLWNFRKVWG